LRRKLKILLIIGITIPLFLVVNHFIILTRIYFKENYDTNIQDFDDIVDKSELFDYLKYCKYRGYGKGEVQNLSRSDSYYHIDRVFLESLKIEIEEDKKKFQIFPSHKRYFIYSLEVSNESLIYLTYNNNSIIKAEHADHTEIFRADWAQWGDSYPRYWTGNWYLNFTQIPFALNESSTVMLNNIFLVKMNLIYNYVLNAWGGQYLRIEQYLFFNSDFQVMLVYFPLASKSGP